MELHWPGRDQLAGYSDALRAGWSPNTMRPEVADEQLAEIARDPDEFLRGLVDPEGRGAPITLPDGSVRPRLPGYQRWIWDGSFCGAINVRWQRGTTELPPHVLGHIGYSVVPWKQRRGYATRALAVVLREIRADRLILPFVELTTDVDNIASQRVIEVNGGVKVDRFTTPSTHGTGEMFRFRIATD